MRCRIFNIFTLISTILLAVTVLLWIGSFSLNPWDHRWSITADLHVAVWKGPGDEYAGRLVIFNDKDYGPYRGSSIGLVDAQGNIHPPRLRQLGFGDRWGIYYRYFRWPTNTLWTLMLSLWYPLLVFAALPVVWLCFIALRRRRIPGHCPKCDYDLRGSVGANTCPECGADVKGAAQKELQQDPG